jgi:hypothetical protein
MKSLKRLSVVIVLMLSAQLIGQTGVKISDLNPITASTITDDTLILFGTANLQDTPATPRKLSLADLKQVGDIRKVATVAALQAVTNAKDNQRFMTDGYSVEGVGANLYRYDAASAATADGGFVITATGMGVGRYIAVDQTVADVTKFGSVGDGVADDTAAVQAAIAAAVALSIPAYAPSGIYSCDTWSAYSLSGSVRLVIYGDGQSTVFNGNSTYFISKGATAELDLRSCAVVDFTSAVFQTGASQGALNVRDVVITNGTDGIGDGDNVTSQTSVVIEGCTISGQTRSGVLLRYSANTGSVAVKHNYIHSIASTNTAFGICIGKSVDTATNGAVIISDNYVKSVSSTNIAQDGRSVNIERNKVESISAPGASVDKEGIYTKASYSVISQNKLLDAGGFEGSIVLKGDNRAGAFAGNPDGFSNIISGNSIQFSPAYQNKKTFTVDYLTNNAKLLVADSGFSVGDKVICTTTLTTPTGITAGSSYIVASVDASGMTLNTIGGSPVTMSSNGTGTLSVARTCGDGIKVEDAGEAIISSNVIDNAAKAIATNDADGVTVIGNFINGAQVTAIDFYDTSCVSCTGNTIKNYTPAQGTCYAIFIRAEGESVSAITITGNVFSGTGLVGVQFGATYSFAVFAYGTHSVSNVTITGNSVDSGFTDGYWGWIVATGAINDVVYSNNVIKATREVRASSSVAPTIKINSGWSQTYTTSNVSADRSYDANSTSTEELADIVGTLIVDLKSAGAIK